MPFTHRGKCFIARHEACVLVPYQDGAHLSQGYGHNDPALKPDSPAITFEQAWEWLDADLVPREKVILRWLKVPVEQHQLEALVSGYYQSGSKMQRVVELINLDHADEAVALWLTFNRNQGKFSDGLAERRHQERRLFRKADYGDEAKPAPKLKLWRGNPSTTAPEEIDFPKENA